MSDNQLQKDEYYLPGDLGTVQIGNQVRDIKQVFRGKDGSVTFTIGATKPEPLLHNGNKTGLSFYHPEKQIQLPAKTTNQ